MRGSSLRVERAFIEANPPMPSGNGRFRTAANHHFRRTALDNFEGIANGMCEAEHAVAVAEFGPRAP